MEAWVLARDITSNYITQLPPIYRACTPLPYSDIEEEAQQRRPERLILPTSYQQHGF